MFYNLVVAFNFAILFGRVSLAAYGVYQAVYGSVILAILYYVLAGIVGYAFVDIPETKKSGRE